MFRTASLLAAGLFAGVSAACAQGVETVTVTGDAAHLIATDPDDTAFGLAKPLIETPRALTLVSATTLDRYGIGAVDDLTAITPSAYTASYYGVAGAVNLRGTLAENYFRGFKRTEDRGTYDTPLGDAAEIDILRGPPSAIYGAGKVGGFINFVPKSAVGAFGGDVALTYGSYSKRNLSAGIGTPIDLGFAKGSVHVYGEIDDSFSFYRGLHPSHQMLQASASFGMDAWTFSADYMYLHANGQVQTPGWNRLTQSLIDSGTYVTGRDTSLADGDGDGRLTLNDFGGNPYAYSPAFQSLLIAVPCTICSNAVHTLDVGVGTTVLGPRTVYIAKGVDFSNTVTHTGFAELARALEDGDMLRLQGFVDTLENDRFVSYGFPGSYRTQVYETRLRYDFKRDAFGGKLTAQNVAGLSYRYVHAIGKESYNSGVIALDRRDISFGPTPGDIIDSPFNVDPPGTQGLGWENDVRSNTADAGAFLVSDLVWDHGLDLTLSGRYDDYNVRSVDRGVLPYEPAAGRGAKGSLTYSASLSYKTGFGLVPYLTNAKSAAVEIGQADQVLTSLLAARDWLSSSALNEAGVKFAFLDDHLTGALDWYAQTRTQLNQGPPASVLGTRSKGAELEIRYVLSDAVSFTFVGNLQHTLIDGPDHEFAYLPARVAGVPPAQGFGGSYVTYDFSALVPGNYEDRLVPHAVLSPYVTYTGAGWGATFGGTYVSSTAQTVPNPIHFPAYVTLNGSVFATMDVWKLSLNVDNIASARYFTPGADTYANLAALPGEGRSWRITVQRNF